MAFMMKAYEDELKRPIRSAVTGQLPRTLLIQVLHKTTKKLYKPPTPTLKTHKPRNPTMKTHKPQTPTIKTLRPQTPTIKTLRPQTPTVQTLKPQTPSIETLSSRRLPRLASPSPPQVTATNPKP